MTVRPTPALSATPVAPDALPTPSPSTVEPEPRYVIKASTGLIKIDLPLLWRYRDLIRFLTLRDIQLRYRQTFLGVAWALIQPVATMTIFSVFFGRLGKMPSEGLPYPLFAFCGLLPWQLFAYALTEASNSLVANQQLVTKIYFPRLVIPMSAVLAGLVDFSVSMVLLMVLMAFYGVWPHSGILVLPLLLLLALCTALGVGLWLSALNVRYRDVRYTIPFITQFWFFATPIAYPASLVPEKWQPLLGLNPMAGVVEGFRWALLGTGHLPTVLWVSAGVSMVFLYTGLLYFNRMERTFADVV